MHLTGSSYLPEIITPTQLTILHLHTYSKYVLVEPSSSPTSSIIGVLAESPSRSSLS